MECPRKVIHSLIGKDGSIATGLQVSAPITNPKQTLVDDLEVTIGQTLSDYSWNQRVVAPMEHLQHTPSGLFYFFFGKTEAYSWRNVGKTTGTEKG